MRHIGDVTRGMGDPQPRGTGDPYAGGIMTKHGWFSYEELGGSLGKMTTDMNGNRVVSFPYAFAANGEPMYRDIPEHKLNEGKAINGKR